MKKIQIEKSCGTTRRVTIFNHIVIKIAIIDFKGFLKARRDLKEIDLKEYEKEFEDEAVRMSSFTGLSIKKAKAYEMAGFPASYLLAGIMANLQEFYFTIFHRNNFIMPTYFSFFGLINIQKKGDKITFWDSEDIWAYVCKNSIHRNQPYCDSHVFSNIDNFCIDRGKLRICDYGSRNVQEFLNLNGERLFSRFIKPIKQKQL